MIHDNTMIMNDKRNNESVTQVEVEGKKKARKSIYKRRRKEKRKEKNKNIKLEKNEIKLSVYLVIGDRGMYLNRFAG